MDVSPYKPEFRKSKKQPKLPHKGMEKNVLRPSPYVKVQHDFNQCIMRACRGRRLAASGGIGAPPCVEMCCSLLQDLLRGQTGFQQLHKGRIAGHEDVFVLPKGEEILLAGEVEIAIDH